MIYNDGSIKNQIWKVYRLLPPNFTVQEFLNEVTTKIIENLSFDEATKVLNAQREQIIDGLKKDVNEFDLNKVFDDGFLVYTKDRVYGYITLDSNYFIISAGKEELTVHKFSEEDVKFYKKLTGGFGDIWFIKDWPGFTKEADYHLTSNTNELAENFYYRIHKDLENEFKPIVDDMFGKPNVKAKQ